MNRLQKLHEAGQSIWLDFIDRDMLRDGELERRIADDALTGMTSNPTIFEKALAEGTAYDEQLANAPAALSSWDRFELIETDDVRSACDIFGAVHERSGGGDGFVSIEVSPSSAHDTDATVLEACRLWAMVGRPNVMIKVPGTPEGAAAVRRLIAEGVNVNITLLFSRDAYDAVIEAYLSGLEERVSAGKTIHELSSVASFFVSRVDTEVDKRLSAKIEGASPEVAERLRKLQGRVAVANAKLAYALFRERFAGPRWEALAAQGARLQRPLWASTSTKNPAYRDVMYVEDLIGPDTVNTMPPATIEAFREHGVVKRTVDADLDAERTLLAELEELGVSLESVTGKLLVDGLESFQKSFESLIARIESKSTELTKTAG
jgi:transaldolase